MNQFEKNDSVTILNGETKMTVIGYSTNGLVECCWEDSEGNPKVESFNENVLKKFEPKKMNKNILAAIQDANKSK